MAYLDFQNVIDNAREQNANLSRRFPDDDLLYRYLYQRVDPKVWTGNKKAEFEPPENIFEARREAQEKSSILANQNNLQDDKTIITINPKKSLAEFNIAGALGDLFDSNYLKLILIHV